MKNAINWFEIPASNFDRAVKFYNSVFVAEMYIMPMGGCQMGFFPCDQGSVGGAIVTGEGYKPSSEGTMVYLNGGDDLNIPLNRVESAGGKVLVPKTLITEEIGYFAIFMDCEGNKVAFHSMK